MSEGPICKFDDSNEFIDACPDDFVRYNVHPEQVLGAWSDSNRAAFVWLTQGERRVWLGALGRPDITGALLAQVRDHVPVQPDLATLPNDVVPVAPEWARPHPDKSNQWEWMCTSKAVGVVKGEDLVELLEETPAVHAEIAALLQLASPSHSADPGDESVQRWVGIRDEVGALIATACEVHYLPDIPHLASIATAPSHRGRGLGAAVTNWLTRDCLAAGAPVSTLGLYSHNSVARRMYSRLGYRGGWFMTSGKLPSFGDSAGLVGGGIHGASHIHESTGPTGDTGDTIGDGWPPSPEHH